MEQKRLDELGVYGVNEYLRRDNSINLFEGQNNGFSGIKMERAFSFEKDSPFRIDYKGEPINWVSEDVNITDDLGKVVFKQSRVKRPDFWSPLAIKIVAGKYFWGDQAKGEREDSVEKIIGRVSRFLCRQGINQKYFNEHYGKIFEDEIASICLNQFGVFNSPVWFNVGIHEYDKSAGGVSAYIWDSEQKRAVDAEKWMDKPQCSACFIQSVEDNMESIMAVQVAEANLFKAGSGTGTNRSMIRSSKERLTGGGRASGPVSFMRGYDAYAGVIKSGGKTRRAAKMEILNVDHPDIMEFIEAKSKEEKKAWALIEQGYDGGMNGEAYRSVCFQNCNMSVRVPDEFMEAVKNDGKWSTRFVKNGEICETFKARDILNKIAEGTWICGDPGIQCDGIINQYHTCKNSGRINASNPCVTGDTKVLIENGRWARIDSILNKDVNILTNTGVINKLKINGSFKTGKKPVYTLTTKSGYELKLTADHKVFTVNRGFIQACELTKDDYVLLPKTQVGSIEEPKDKTFYQMLGVYLGDGGSGKSTNRGIILSMNKYDEREILQEFADYVAISYKRKTHQSCPAQVCMAPTSCRYSITNTSLLQRFDQMVELQLPSHQKRISGAIFNLTLGEQKYVLQGLFTSDGTVANYGEKSQYVALDSSSLQLLKDVQILLLGFGVKSKLYANRRAGKNISLLPDRKGGLKEYSVKEMHSLRISRSSRIKFERLIGFMPQSKKSEKLRRLNENVGTYQDFPIDAVKSLEYAGEEEVYDLTEPVTHTFVANGITVHNCSEYIFLDDSACNLSSINLMKFRTADGGFDIERFRKTVRSFVIAMDIIVDGASYPTKKICENSHLFRPLGLGYANLGALLMSLGLPYDSGEGRAVAAAITAILGGEAYRTSAEIAKEIGAFSEFQKNREGMLDVIRMHRDNVKKIDVEAIPEELRDLVNIAWDCWSEALELGERYGFRNAQTTVLAPTGTIAFMLDCDTTGIEPDIALVKYKILSGGGMLKMVNRSVPLALNKLGYKKEQIIDIADYITKNDMIEDAPHVKEEHLAVFDCAFKPAKGKRAIFYKGHVDMMSVVQPFISGAISKTINMPENATINDIADAYIYAWEKKLKAVAVYRENSKRSQPLNTKKTEGELVKKEEVKRVRERIPLPQTRRAINHKFEIAGHTGYLSIGLYDDGSPGEIFVTMAKQGSTIRGLLDAWARSISFNLQYGAPVNYLFGKFMHQKFEPAGFVKNDGGGAIDEKIKVIRTASSIVDYVAQFMLNNFGEGAKKIEVESKDFEKTAEEQAELTDFGNEGITCPICGGPAKRIGNCAIRCTSCMQTTRSGCGE